MADERDPKATVGGRLAVWAAQRWTRRGFLARTGVATAGLFGVGFATSVMAPGTALASTECTHEDEDPDACGATGTKCKFYNGMECGRFANNASCPGCVITDGCPGGTNKGGSWFGCCACKNDTSKPKEKFLYIDCCGTQYSAACNLCTGVSSCHATPFDDRSWCSPAVGRPLCTIVQKASDNTGC